MSNNLITWLPGSLKENDFWIQLMEVLNDEFNLFRQELIDPLNDYFKIKENSNIDDLIDVAMGYGYTPDRSLDDSLSFLQFDVESIGHRKKYLTTYLGYEYLYKNIGYLGDVFILYYEGNKLIRAENGENFNRFDSLTDCSVPIIFTAERNYSEFFSGTLSYDQNPPWNYDLAGSFYDAAFFRTPTKHVAIEYFLDKTIVEDGNDYLMTNIFFEYLLTGANYNRRAIETPHCGTQLTLLMDSTGDYDSCFIDPQPYSIPDLKLKNSVQPSVFSTITDPSQIYKIVVGTGTQGLRSQDGSGAYPTSIVSPIYETILEPEEIYEASDYWLVQSIVGIDAKLDYLLSDVPGTSVSSTIINVPIQRNSLKVFYSIGGTSLEGLDDGNGNIVGPNITSGTINYITGSISITFDTAFDVDVTCQFNFNSLYKETNSNFSLTEITEVGLLDENEDLIAYGTFPPIQYNDNKFHTSYQFYIKKTSF